MDKNMLSKKQDTPALDLLSGGVKIGKKRTTLKISVSEDMVNTNSLPLLSELVQKELLGLHNHRCFNPKDQPFSEELKNTELGHFIEHVILEYLHQYEAKSSGKRTFKGVTSWNWKKEKKGVFHISLNIGQEDKDALDFAFQKAADFLNTVFNFHSPVVTV